jgi:hypothetical protein
MVRKMMWIINAALERLIGFLSFCAALMFVLESFRKALKFFKINGQSEFESHPLTQMSPSGHRH